MRKPWFECAVMAVGVIVASCSFPTDRQAPSCESDAQTCPTSSKAATSVTCDCRCTVGISEDTGTVYDGRVAVCLPPELNGEIAVGEARTGLRALDAHLFDQRVYQYCSQDVARFVRTAIKAPIGLRACAMPLRCECTTTGAAYDSSACHTSCEDVDCSLRNCPGVLWRGSKLDASVCRCSRAAACGIVSPAAERPGVCRDWATPVGPPRQDDGGAL